MKSSIVFFQTTLPVLASSATSLGVERSEDELVFPQDAAAVDDVAARQDALRQTRVVFPQLLAGVRVDRVGARVRAGDVDHAVLDECLALLAALLLAAERETTRPG